MIATTESVNDVSSRGVVTPALTDTPDFENIAAVLSEAGERILAFLALPGSVAVRDHVISEEAGVYFDLLPDALSQLMALGLAEFIVSSAFHGRRWRITPRGMVLNIWLRNLYGSRTLHIEYEVPEHPWASEEGNAPARRLTHEQAAREHSRSWGAPNPVSEGAAR